MGTTREIVAKAAKDAEFRKRLLKDSKATIKKDFGIEFPDNVTVRVHENSDKVINLVLPAAVELSTDRSLSAEQLSQVSGGALGGGATFGGFTSCCTRVKKPKK